MRLSISQTTRYAFSGPVTYALQRLRMQPKTSHGQVVIDWRMALDGAVVEAEYDDHQRNRTSLISAVPGATQVSITCKGTVETSDRAGILGPHTGLMPLWCFLRPTLLTQPGPKTRALVARLDADRADKLAQLHALSQAVLDQVSYVPGATDVATTAEEALAAGHGVCQDHAQIFIAAGRLLGNPMRYVSGYLMMDGQVDQKAGHGWAEAHVNGLGWVGFDVSNAISPDERYVRVATGCDYSDAAPISGLSLGVGSFAPDIDLAVEPQPADQ